MRPACLKSPKLAAFADLWFDMRARTDLGLPSNEGFPLESFAPYLPNLAVTRRRGDDTPYYHFYGTDLAREFGHDMTDKDVTTNMTAEAKEQFLQVIAIADAQEMQGIAINGRWFVGEVVTQDGRGVELEGLTLPFFAKEGEVRRATYHSVVGGIALGDQLGAHYPKTDGIEFNALNDRPSWMYLRSGSAASE